MWSCLAFRFCLVLLSSFLAATLPELFQRAKEEFRFGSYTATLVTLETLERESARPGHESEWAALRPGLLFYRGASLAALGRQAEARGAFDEFLSYRADTKLDPAFYPHSVIAAFESAREARKHEARPSEGPSLAESYRAFARPDPGRPEGIGENWAEGPVGRLLTAEEKRSFARLQDPIERSEFVAGFWRSRDPRPETGENEFLQEFEKRVAFADSRFAQDEVRGSLTDRGMVFILMGPPAYSGRKALLTGGDSADSSGLSRYSRSEIRAASQPGGSNADRQAREQQVGGPGTKALDAASNWVEVWHYLRGNLPRGGPYQELILEFVTKQGYGKDVLQRDPNVLTSLEKAREAIRRPV
jgi:GWxTD domain-containing protein